MGQIQALRDSFASRIDELEDFYGDNDSDDRAVLFEKQRLRLRQALQVANPSPKKAPAPSSPSAITTPGGKSATLGSPSTTPKSATLGGRKSTTPKSATKTTPGSSPRKKKSPGPPKPLYVRAKGAQRRAAQEEDHEGHRSCGGARAKKSGPRRP